MEKKKKKYCFISLEPLQLIKVSNRGILLTNYSENSAEDSHLQSQPVIQTKVLTS